MADPVPQAEPHFRVAETLHYGGETTVTGLSPEMQGYKDRAKQLREERANNPDDAKSFLKSRKEKSNEKNLTKRNQEDLSLKFGAGEVIKKDDGTIEVPATFKSPEAEALYREAQAVIKDVDKVIQCSEIAAEAEKTGKSITIILIERTAKGIEGPKTQREFDAQKEKALDDIINTEVIRQGFPELSTITNPADRRKLIDETLATDLALRTKILEKMVSIAEEAKNLPEQPTNKEVEDAKDSKTEAEASSAENLNLIRDSLKGLGIEDARAEALRKDIEKYLKDGKSLDQVLGYLKSEALGQLKNIPVMQEYSRAINLAEALQKRLDSFDVSKTVPAVITDTQSKLTVAQGVIDRFEGNPDLVTELDRYHEIIRTFNNQKDNSSSTTEGGIYLSPVAHEIDQVIKAQKAILNADKVIKGKGELNETALESWRVNRLVIESGLISKMRNVVSSSIAEVLSDRYDEMVGLEKQRMARVAEEEGKKGNAEIARGIKNVSDKMDTNWVEDNQATRKKQVHTEGLSSDVRYIAYAKKEDGLKRIVGRDSGIQMKDASGNLVDIDWKNVDIETLPEDVKKTLEGVYSSTEDAYKKKLLGDFFRSQSAISRTIFGVPIGKLALTQRESELLQEKYGDVFEKSVTAKAELKAKVEDLKKKGTKMNGGLLAILALLFAVPVMGVKKALEG